MKTHVLLLLFIGFLSPAWPQYQTSQAHTWESYPPEVQKPGFGLHQSQLVQMDDHSGLEEVLLFSAHNGHYPYFDIFKNYIVIMDNYSKEVKFISDVTLSVKRDILVEDRNEDGKFEIYRSYFQDGKFTVDQYGNKLAVTWAYDRIEWNAEMNRIGKNK